MTAIELDISGLVNQQIRQTLTEHLSTIDLKDLVEQSIAAAVDDAIQRVTQRATESFLKQNDPAATINSIVNNKLDKHIESLSASAARAALASVNLNTMVAELVKSQLEVMVQSLEFPSDSIPARSINWNDTVLSGSKVVGGLIKDFNSTGIQDNASSCQLTIVDGVIVVEGHFVSKGVQTDSIKTVDLEVLGSVKLSDQAKADIAAVTNDTVSNRVNPDWDLTGNRIVLGKQLLIDAGTLGPSVSQSNLRKLGLLQELRVSGHSRFGETMAIMDSKVGINTEEPVGALTVWDEDAELTVTKLSKRQMFVGSSRTSDVALGTNMRPQITLSQEGGIALADSVTIQGIRFGVEDNIPERSGQPLEIVMVRNAAAGQPLFYICKGGNKWASLGVVA
jgi:hypothetical protein